MRSSQDSAARRDWGSQDSDAFESGREGKISFPLLSERHEGLGREVGEGLGNWTSMYLDVNKLKVTVAGPSDSYQHHTSLN